MVRPDFHNMTIIDVSGFSAVLVFCRHHIQRISFFFWGGGGSFIFLEWGLLQHNTVATQQMIFLVFFIICKEFSSFSSSQCFFETLWKFFSHEFVLWDFSFVAHWRWVDVTSGLSHATSGAWRGNARSEARRLITDRPISPMQKSSHGWEHVRTHVLSVNPTHPFLLSHWGQRDKLVCLLPLLTLFSNTVSVIGFCVFVDYPC